MPNEEFEKWLKEQGGDLATLGDKYSARRGFDARQPEIDALRKHNNGLQNDNSVLATEIFQLQAEVSKQSGYIKVLQDCEKLAKAEVTKLDAAYGAALAQRDTLQAEVENLQYELLRVRSDYKLELKEENSALKQALIKDDGVTAECFTGNCHHTRKETK